MDANIEISVDTEADLPAVQSLQSRYILTQVGQQQLTFPSQWVSDVMLVERSQVLSLPFYDPMLLGLVYRQGRIVPLISAHIMLAEKPDQDMRLKAIKETLTVIHLGQAVQQLAGVGIVVEHVVSNSTTQVSSKQRIFQLSDLPNDIWQPRR